MSNGTFMYDVTLLLSNTTTNLTEYEVEQIALMSVGFTFDAVLLFVSFFLMLIFSRKQPLKSRGLTPYLITFILFVRIVVILSTQFTNNCSLPILSGM